MAQELNDNLLLAKKLIDQFALGNSLFRCQVSDAPFEQTNVPIPREDYIKIRNRDMALALSEHIINKTPRSISEKTENGMCITTMEVLVLELSLFKSIVEAAIGLMTDEQIDMIKNGISVLR